MRIPASVLMLTMLLAGCGSPPSNPHGNAAAGSENLVYMQDVPADRLPHDSVDLPLKEIMAHVFQFSGDQIWKRQGYRTDATGEHSLFPKNTAEWEEAESAALTLAEISNILLLPGRRVDDPRWGKAVAEVRAVALRAAKAAEAQDKEAFFKAGGDLDTACESCHRNFASWATKSPAPR